MQENDLHTRLFTLAILRFHESSFLKQLENKWWKKSQGCPEEEDSGSKLTVIYFCLRSSCMLSVSSGVRYRCKQSFFTHLASTSTNSWEQNKVFRQEKVSTLTGLGLDTKVTNAFHCVLGQQYGGRYVM